MELSDAYLTYNTEYNSAHKGTLNTVGLINILINNKQINEILKRWSKSLYFHFSIDDVLNSLIEVTDSKIQLIDHPFFRELRILYEQFGLITTLYLFENCIHEGRRRYLSEVRALGDENSDGWLKFAPHAINAETAPYAQTIRRNISDFKKIFTQISRISKGNIANSIRLHYYSECYELSQFLRQYGINEIFTTDRPIISYRLPELVRLSLAKNGSQIFKDIRMTSTHIRVEDLLSNDLGRTKIREKFSSILKITNRIIIYSHEYEHSRIGFSEKLFDTIEILSEDLNLQCGY